MPAVAMPAIATDENRVGCWSNAVFAISQSPPCRVPLVLTLLTQVGACRTILPCPKATASLSRTLGSHFVKVLAQNPISVSRTRQDHRYYTILALDDKGQRGSAIPNMKPAKAGQPYSAAINHVIVGQGGSSAAQSGLKRRSRPCEPAIFGIAGARRGRAYASG